MPRKTKNKRPGRRSGDKKMRDAEVPIQFKSNIKNEDDDKKSKKVPKQEFQVKLDPEGDNSRLNIQTVKIDKLTSLTRNGEAFVHLLRNLRMGVRFV